MYSKRYTNRKRMFRSLFVIILMIAVTLSSMPDLALAATNKTAVTTVGSKTDQTKDQKDGVTVSSQKKLNEALNDKKITTITIKSSSSLKLTIPKKSYKTKTLIVNGSKIELNNSGVFHKITILNAKNYKEFANGNIITISDTSLNLQIDKKALIKELNFNKANQSINIEVNGTIKKTVLSKKAKLVIKGKPSKKVPIQITVSAKSSQITSSTPIVLKTVADTKIFLKPGAEKSEIITTDQKAVVVVENKTKKSITIVTPDGKITVAAGKTGTTKSAKPTLKPTLKPDTPMVTESPIKEPTPTPTAKPSPTISIPGGNHTTVYNTITFDSVGGTTIAPVRVVRGTTLSTLPVPQKDSSIFLGWYLEPSYQYKFTESTPVYSDTTIYARYSVIEMEQLNLNDRITLTDQSSTLEFTITSNDTTMTPESIKNSLDLEVADGSTMINLIVTGGNGNYKVKASDGFTEGASYVLTLKDNRLNFLEKENTIRKCSFTIAKAEVYNIEFNKDIIYIPSSDVSNMTQNGSKTDALSVSVITMSMEKSGDNTASGTFTYNGNRILKVGDTLCIYSHNKPIVPRDGGDDSEYLDDDIAYVTVVSVNGTPGNQVVSYTDAAAVDVIFMPDVLPIYVGYGHILENYTAATADTIGSFTIDSTKLNFEAFDELGLSDETTIDEGDFIAFYEGDFFDNQNTDTVIYGEVTDITTDNGDQIITFTTTDIEKMQEILDYYSKNDVDSEVLLEDVDISSLERDIERQAEESGFAKEASSYLTTLALKTDGFKDVAGDGFRLEDLTIHSMKGEELDLNHVRKLASSSKVSVENLKVKANISNKLQKLSGSGVRCDVTVSFEVPVNTGKDGAIVISISATFVEEIKLSVDASGKAIWKKKWIFPYIADYQMNANIDIYDYTGISFKAVILSASKGSKDISEEIQKILSNTKSEEISAGVQELFDIYGDMMENETDWVKIFSKNIVTSNQRLLLGVIHIRTTIDFVVSANVNVALGCNFEYRSGTRYIFWAKIGAKDAGSSQVNLMDEKYTFQFYVMGMLGLRAGIRLEFAVGLFTVDLNSVGLTAEAGVYAKLYGYFFYQLESVNKLKNSRMSGALYLDFGIYLDIAFKAQVLNGKYQYNPTLYKKEWPLLSAGTRYNVYNFAYEDKVTTIKLKDNVKSFTLPNNTFHMIYLDLKEGDISQKTYSMNDFNITFTNPNFSLSGNTVKVNVPTGTHILEGDMIIMWKRSPLAFSSLPMTRKYRIIWDNLNDNGYTITYDSNGGSQVSGITKLYGEKLTAPKDPVKMGYTFEGWYSDVELTKKYIFDTMPAGNMVLYAKWSPNKNTQYKVEYYLQNLENDNYTLVEKDTLTGITGEQVTAVRKSYSGFSYNTSEKDIISTGNIAADGSLVLKLYYSRNSYTLTFRPNNGGSDITKLVKFGATVAAPIVIKTGYIFAGWDRTVIETMPASDVVYTATWTPILYTIEFNSNGGDTVNAIKGAYGTNVNAPKTPEKPGYVFVGWYRDSSLTKAYTFTTMPAENITLYAKWAVNNQIAYQVEHYQQDLTGNGYTLIDTEVREGALGTVVTASPKSYTGFTFNQEVFETINTGTIAADGSLVLKLYYDRNSYTLSFKPENGDNDIVKTMKYGEVIAVPTVEKIGYSFVGWDKAVEETMPAADRTYVATWTPMIVTIEFNSDGGSAVETINAAYGTAINEPTEPVKQGYIFGGWYLDDDLTEQYSFNTMLAENITLFAKWIPNVSSDEILEAEDAYIYGFAEVEYNSTASNGAHVGYIDWENSGVRFDHMRQCDQILLRYASEMDGTISIYVNGVKQGEIFLVHTGSYMEYATVVVIGLSLSEGDSLAFQYDSGNVSINIDYISYQIIEYDAIVEIRRITN